MDSPANAFLVEAFDALLMVPFNPPNYPVMHLAAAAFAPGPALNPGTLTEATFDGYAAQPAAGFGTPHLVANGNVIMDFTPAYTWTPTGSTTANTIFGWWVMDHAGNLVSSGLLPTPVLLHGAGTTLSIVYGIGVAPWNYTSVVLP
jgi:hypothetical protein